MNAQDKRYFTSQKKLLDYFFVEEARAEQALKDEEELGEIMGAKYGTDPRTLN